LVSCSTNTTWFYLYPWTALVNNGFHDLNWSLSSFLGHSIKGTINNLLGPDPLSFNQDLANESSNLGVLVDWVKALPFFKN